MAPLGKFTSHSDGEPETLFGGGASGSAPAPWIQRGKCMSFVSTRELSTPLCSPRLKSWVRNKARLSDLRPFNCERSPRLQASLSIDFCLEKNPRRKPTDAIHFVASPH